MERSTALRVGHRVLPLEGGGQRGGRLREQRGSGLNRPQGPEPARPQALFSGSPASAVPGNYDAVTGLSRTDTGRVSAFVGRIIATGRWRAHQTAGPLRGVLAGWYASDAARSPRSIAPQARVETVAVGRAEGRRPHRPKPTRAANIGWGGPTSQVGPGSIEVGSQTGRGERATSEGGICEPHHDPTSCDWGTKPSVPRVTGDPTPWQSGVSS